jgi:hypothetical protein
MGQVPPNFLKGPKVPFFVMKSALFVQANVAVNTKLTSKVAILFENFDAFKKSGSKRAISVYYDEKIFSLLSIKIFVELSKMWGKTVKEFYIWF